MMVGKEINLLIVRFKIGFGQFRLSKDSVPLALAQGWYQNVVQHQKQQFEQMIWLISLQNSIVLKIKQIVDHLRFDHDMGFAKCQNDTTDIRIPRHPKHLVGTLSTFIKNSKETQL